MNRSPSPLQRGHRLRAAALPLLWAVHQAGAGAALEARGRFPVRTLSEMKRANVVRQGWDLSCGAAALSTLLTYEQRDPVGESEIIETLLRQRPLERVRARHGFSLLDLKRFAVSRGYRAEGYGLLDALDLDRLTPAIVPLSAGDVLHFVVVRGIEAGHVILADPAFGNRTMTLARFKDFWSPRIAFVVRRDVRGAVEPARDAAHGDERPSLVPWRVVRQKVGGWP